MSWFVSSKGFPEAVRADVVAQFEKQLSSYPIETEEGKDIGVCFDRTIAILDALTIEDFANAVEVDCKGSRTPKMSGSFSILVNRIHLAK